MTDYYSSRVEMRRGSRRVNEGVLTLSAGPRLADGRKPEPKGIVDRLRARFTLAFARRVNQRK